MQSQTVNRFDPTATARWRRYWLSPGSRGDQRRNRRWPHWFVALIFVLTIATGTAAPPLAIPYRPDRILVQPKETRTLARLTVHAGLPGAKILRTFPALGDLQVVQLPEGTDVATAIHQYGLYAWVEFAEPDYWVHSSAVPNDPDYLSGMLWGLHNTGQAGGLAGIDIDAERAWDTIHSAADVIVALIDSGVRYTHQDLRANLWTNPAEVAGNGIDDDANGFVDDVNGINAIKGNGDPWDDYGHGTHVSGIIGAAGNNAVGVTGVAWRVQLMTCKFLDNQGTGSVSDAIQCLDYARIHGARIINASWGFDEFSRALYSAVARARDAGIIFVAAAGNEGYDTDFHPEYPADFELDNVVSVMAINRVGDVPGFSNFGVRTVHLAAPGSDIYSTWRGLDTTYAYYNGSSMAAAFVSGAFALLSAQYPQENYRQLISRVLATTKPLATLTGKCATGGCLSLAQALGPVVVANFTPSVTNGPAPLAVHFTNDSVGAAELQWDFGDGLKETSTVSPIHVFSDPGRYTVSLTIAGGDGSSKATTRSIEVTAAGASNPLTLVSNDGAAFAGRRRGPFAPELIRLALGNTGTESLSWIASTDQDWFELSATNGSLMMGGTDQLIIRITTNALEFIPGRYLGQIRFSDPADGRLWGIQTLELEVRVSQPLLLSVLAPRPDGPLPIRAFGDPGTTVQLEASTNCLDWTPMATNRIPREGMFEWSQPLGASGQQYYRAVGHD
jgi:subtilisin family serine protease